MLESGRDSTDLIFVLQAAMWLFRDNSAAFGQNRTERGHKGSSTIFRSCGERRTCSMREHEPVNMNPSSCFGTPTYDRLPACRYWRRRISNDFRNALHIAAATLL